MIQLSNVEAKQSLPVELSGQVTYSDPEWGLLFLQDGTGAIYIDVHPQGLDLAPGDLVVVQAQTSPGALQPILVKAKVSRRQSGVPLPIPRFSSVEELDSGSLDSTWVETTGVLRPTGPMWNRVSYYLYDGSKSALLVVPEAASSAARKLAGARVRVRGVCAARLDGAGKRLGAHLFVSHLSDIAVEDQPVTDPFDLRVNKIGDLVYGSRDGRFQLPVHVRGVVTFVLPKLFYIEDATGGIAVSHAGEPQVQLGDSLDVVGFPSNSYDGPTLANSLFQPGVATQPKSLPAMVPADVIVSSAAWGRQARVRARIVEQTETETDHLFTLEDAGLKFNAVLPKTHAGHQPLNIPLQSMLEVTGVPVLRQGKLTLLIGSNADFVLMESDGWLTLKKILPAAGILASLTLGTLVWVGLLRRTVRQQTATIRQRLERENQLASEYRRLFERNLAGVFRWKPDGTILDCNDAFARMLGFERREEVVGLSYWSFETDEREHERLRSTLTRDALSNREACLHPRHGEPVWLLENITPVDTPAGCVFETTAIDVTQLKRYQQELKSARDDAEAISSSKSAFLANMSHEIRTPLNAIIGMTELALGTRLDEEQQEYLAAVRNSSNLLLTLINDVLDFSKIEAGKLQLESTEFDLEDAVSRVVRGLSVEAYRKNLELTCSFSLDLPRRVVGDPTRFTQVLNNLMSNACKFTEQGEVAVTVSLDSAATDDAGHYRVRVAVRDTGIGIEEAKRSLIFESFSQADISTTRRFGGTGLGLSISAKLIQLMGGELKVESQAGAGSTFSFATPFGIPIAPADRLPRPLPQFPEAKALLADPHPGNRRIMAELLAAHGIAVYVATDSRQVLELEDRERVAGVPFTIYLLDVDLLKSDGIEMILALRARWVSGHRVLLLTAVASSLASRLHKDGLTGGYLCKPVQPAELSAGLNRILNSNGRASGRNREPVPLLREAPAVPPLNVLVADDNPVNRRLATRMLEKLGCSVGVTDNGQGAVDEWKTGGYDVILMDVQMPGVDGFEATRMIREFERASSGAEQRQTPIVALTAHAMADDRERCLRMGMNLYLAKPVSLAALAAALNEVSAASTTVH